MSRSIKKPYCTDQQRARKGKSTPSRAALAKREANRKVRAAMKRALKDEADQLANGKSYRKASCSWNIRDWSFPSKDPKARRK